jgi:hypothetical protein
MPDQNPYCDKCKYYQPGYSLRGKNDLFSTCGERQAKNSNDIAIAYTHLNRQTDRALQLIMHAGPGPIYTERPEKCCGPKGRFFEYDGLNPLKRFLKRVKSVKARHDFLKNIKQMYFQWFNTEQDERLSRKCETCRYFQPVYFTAQGGYCTKPNPLRITTTQVLRGEVNTLSQEYFTRNNMCGPLGINYEHDRRSSFRRLLRNILYTRLL